MFRQIPPPVLSAVRLAQLVSKVGRRVCLPDVTLGGLGLETTRHPVIPPMTDPFCFHSLSAGDLLRAHMKSGSADGNMVAEMIKQGQIVPSVVTVNLLLDAMRASGKNTFLIDGFPRNKENRDAWETTAGYDCDFVLFFDAPQDVMYVLGLSQIPDNCVPCNTDTFRSQYRLQRLLGRDQGRSDDNETTIKLRFKTFEESSMPVVRYYEQKGKVNSVVATASPEAVYTATKGFFEKYK